MSGPVRAQPSAGGRRRLAVAAAGIVAALVVGTLFVWPLFGSAWYESHDMVAYPVRAIEYVEAWKSGAWWPRWAPDLYGGYGYPLFNFYAPGLFIVSGIFMTFGASALLGLKLALVLFTAGGAAGMFAAVFGEYRRVDAAAVAAAVFVCMGYHFTLVFVRGDLAEYCATCVAPSVIWAYRAIGRVPAARVPRMAIVAALLHAATLIVHTLTGQWLTELLAVIAGATAWSAWRRQERARAFVLAFTLLAGCGLTAIYSIPALLERPLVHIERMIQGGLAVTHNMVVKLPYLAQRGFFYVGWPIVLLPVLAVAAMIRRRRWLGDVAAWTLATAAMIVLLLEISTPLWSYLPFGAFIQFPWRLLVFVSVFGALACGACWRWLVPERAAIALPLAVVAIVAIAYDGWRDLPARIPPMTADRVPASGLIVARQRHTTVISDEYLPRGVLIAPPPDAAYVVQGDRANVESSLRSGTGYKLEVSADRASTLDLRAFWFPGWKVKPLSGPERPVLRMSPNGLVRLFFPSRGYYRVVVYFGVTWLRGLAALCSALALMALLVVPWWWMRRRGVSSASSPG